MYKDRLEEIREEKELKIKDISKMLNFEKDTYGKYEREYVIIPIKHLNTVCNYFGVSLDYIFNFTNSKKYNISCSDINREKMSKRLKEFRKENKLTQVKLAEILNIANGTIAEYERGTNIIATPFLYTICKNYNISADYLLGKIDEPKYLKEK